MLLSRHTRRRDLLAVLGCTTIALRRAATAKGAGRPVRIGFVSGGDEKGATDFVAALREGLAAEGYHEPATLSLDRVYADYSLDRVPALVAELHRRQVELIVTHAAATPIIVKGYRTVPVVYEFSADPVATGIAEDLAHPLFNATGITLMKAELNRKRVEFLHAISQHSQGSRPTTIIRIGLDTAKHVFQVHGVDENEQTVVRRQLRRGEMEKFFGKLAPTRIGENILRQLKSGSIVLVDVVAGKNQYRSSLSTRGFRADLDKIHAQGFRYLPD